MKRIVVVKEYITGVVEIVGSTGFVIGVYPIHDVG